MIIQSILALIIFIFQTPAFAHGFEAGTLVSLSISKKEFLPIKLLAENVLDETQKICSFNISKNKCIKHKVTSAATAETNCYYCIRFNDESWDDIICTPDQEFYLIDTKHWVPAYQLNIGNVLFTKDESVAKISHIQFCKSQLSVYSISVKKSHNFFVGRHAVLTHNFLLPAISAGIGAAFGSGAATGGAASSFFGPVAVGFGLFIGGCIGMVIKTIKAPDKLPHYDISYDLQLFDNHFGTEEGHNKNESENECETKTSQFVQIGGSPDPEDPWGNKWKNRLKASIFEKNAKHIFRNDRGHLNDTTENRKLLIELCDVKNYLGVDRHGTFWYAKNLENGTQLWACVRNNYIRNGGLNKISRKFNHETGLCNL